MATTFSPAAANPNTVFVTKTKCFIGGTGTSTAEYGTEIGFTLSLPEFGATASEIPLEVISNGGKYTAKGVIDYGGGEITFIRDYSDTGQTSLKNAADDFKGTAYNFWMIRPNGSTTYSGTTIFAQVHVMSFKEVAANGPNNAATGSASIKYVSAPSYTAKA